VVARSAGESQPPSVQDHEPTETVPALASDRVASAGVPTSAFLRGPFGVSFSSAKYEDGACEKERTLWTVSAAAADPPRSLSVLETYNFMHYVSQSSSKRLLVNNRDNNCC